ncbi:MAG: aldehyde dehydrogenase family protein, partial [Chloroflexota bacterium]
GGHPTAELFLSWKPNMRLLAETSGKNTMIISSMADHDLAIKDLVYSAFGHNGQKCSASSLSILIDEVYDNPAFMRQLKDAAESLPIGSAWDLSSKITPLVQEPNPDLLRALTTLDEGESWLLEPKMIDGNPRLWSPGIKLGVQPGSFYHKTECFGPVLGIMRASSIESAIDLVNDFEFGLTSGFHSLDDREIEIWREKIEAGNIYINRGTTGAIVQRQPFGGWKKSVFGNGAKAGGPNYVAGLGTWVPQAENFELSAVKTSYNDWMDHYFSQEHDPTGLIGESNHFRYIPVKRMGLLIGPSTSKDKVRLVEEAALTAGVSLVISHSDQDLIPQLAHLERVRILGTPSVELLKAAQKQHIHVIAEPVSPDGRLELRHYFREQAVTETRHRYGNIVPKPEKES